MKLDCFSSLKYDIDYYLCYKNKPQNKKRKSLWMIIEDWVADKLIWLEH